MEIQAAGKEDAKAIRELVWRSRINPMNLNWRHFLIIKDENGRLAACGQIKTHRDGSRELASIAVAEAYRGQGLARAIIERLIEQQTEPLYLTCRSSLERLYEKFAFRRLVFDEMPPYFKYLYRVARFFIRLSGRKESMSVMRRE